ncbi:hypothetical protein CCUG62472_01073 [Mycobacteroides salmoniphilum]|nr:hypothetical protein CCUG62472_01073 [Mycobacteroides salmoniphilum]
MTLDSEIDNALIRGFAAQGWAPGADRGLLVQGAMDRVIDLAALRNQLINSLGLRQERGIVQPVSAGWPGTRYLADSAMGQTLDGAAGVRHQVRVVSDWRTDSDERL